MAQTKRRSVNLPADVYTIVRQVADAENRPFVRQLGIAVEYWYRHRQAKRQSQDEMIRRVDAET